MPHQTFNSFWYGAELSPLEWACLSSFITHGYTFRLFCYDLIEVPNGVILEDAATIRSKDDLFLVNGNVAAFSDIFRYEMIDRYGEWWSDTDVYCFKDDIPDCDYAWAEEDEDNINGAILKFPANDPTLAAINHAAHAIGNKTNTWCEVGPHLLTKYLSGKPFRRHFGDRHSIYPLHWLEAFLVWLPHQNDYVRLRCKGAYFLHLWNSMFDRMGVDRFASPPAGSFLHSIYKPYLNKFTLRDLDSNAYQRTIGLMKAFFNQPTLVDASNSKLGYDITNYCFDELTGGA